MNKDQLPSFDVIPIGAGRLFPESISTGSLSPSAIALIAHLNRPLTNVNNLVPFDLADCDILSDIDEDEPPGLDRKAFSEVDNIHNDAMRTAYRATYPEQKYWESTVSEEVWEKSVYDNYNKSINTYHL